MPFRCFKASKLFSGSHAGKVSSRFIRRKNSCVPCLKDRLVALATRKALLSKLLPSFIYDTYAGIPSRGVHRAVKRVMEFQRRTASPQNPRSGWILKLDVKDFYPSLRHNVILRQLKARINDTNLVKLISQFLSVWAGWQSTPNKGIPLGSSLSPVLSNLYLDSLDHFIKDGLGFKFYARYADDMVFISKDKNELEFILDKTKQFLEEKVGVFLNPGKTLLTLPILITSGVSSLLISG